jgi:hypothetical protein
VSMQAYVGPCICPNHGEVCHRKRRFRRRYCSPCIDYCERP